MVPVSEQLAVTRNKIVVWDEDRWNNPFYSLYAYWHRPLFAFERATDDPQAWEFQSPVEQVLFNWTPYIESVFAFINSRVPESQERFIFEVDEYNAAQASDETRMKPDLDYLTLDRFKKELYGDGLLRVYIDEHPCTLLDVHAVFGIYFSELRRGHTPPILLPIEVPILAVDGRPYDEHIIENAERYAPDDVRYLDAHSTLAVLWSALQGLDRLYFRLRDDGLWDIHNLDVDPDFFTKEYLTEGPLKYRVDQELSKILTMNWYNPLVSVLHFPGIKISHFYLAWLCGSESKPHDSFCFDATAAALSKSTARVVEAKTHRLYYIMSSRTYINLKDSYMLFFGQPCFDRLHDREDLFLEGDVDDHDEYDERVREENLLIAEIATKLNF